MTFKRKKHHHGARFRGFHPRILLFSPFGAVTLLSFPASCAACFSTALEDLAGRGGILIQALTPALIRGERVDVRGFAEAVLWHTLRTLMNQAMMNVRSKEMK